MPNNDIYSLLGLASRARKLSSGSTLIEDIRNRLFVLPDEVKVIPGHGPMTTIEEEKRYNPFF